MTWKFSKIVNQLSQTSTATSSPTSSTRLQATTPKSKLLLARTSSARNSKQNRFRSSWCRAVKTQGARIPTLKTFWQVPTRTPSSTSMVTVCPTFSCRSRGIWTGVATSPKTRGWRTIMKFTFRKSTEVRRSSVCGKREASSKRLGPTKKSNRYLSSWTSTETECLTSPSTITGEYSSTTINTRPSLSREAWATATCASQPAKCKTYPSFKTIRT